MSEKSKGKRKIEYVEVSTDDGEVGLGGRERWKEEEEEEEVVVVVVAEVEEVHDKEEEELHQAIQIGPLIKKAHSTRPNR